MSVTWTHAQFIHLKTESKKERDRHKLIRAVRTFLSYQQRCRPAPSFHSCCCTLIWKAGIMSLPMQRCAAQTRVIAILFLKYPQVCEWGSFLFIMRRLEIRFSVTSALTQRRPSTETTKGVKCKRYLKNALRYFYLFNLSAVYRHF